MISEWVAIVTLGLVLASYIWTASFKFASLEERMVRFEEKLDDLTLLIQSMKINTDKSPLIEYRLTKIEGRLDNLEPRVSAIEKK